MSTRTPLIEHTPLAQLEACEHVIRHALGRVGRVLRIVRDGHLYRGRHGTWDAYCQTTWGIDAVTADLMIEDAEERV